MEKPKPEYTKRQFLKKGLWCLGGTLCLANPAVASMVTAMPVPRIKPSMPDVPARFRKEAMFYEQVPQGVKCMVCPNSCTIKEGATGDCRNRLNDKGKLYSIAYGNPCSANVDPIEKKPLYHFHPSTYAFSIATAGCNLACLNCQNWTISQSSPSETRNYDLMPQAVVESAIKNNCKSIAYTYSEPITFYEYTYDTSRLARNRGIKNVLVSNGYINEPSLRELAKYTDAANIDLKSFSDSIYLKLNGGTLQPVLTTLKVLNELNVWLEITNLVVPGYTDDLAMIRKMCNWLVTNGFTDNPLHFSRFHPQYKLTRLPSTPVDTLEKAREIALETGLHYVYIGNVSGTEAENTFCPSCKKLLVERKGYKITINNIVSGKCKFCQQVIKGRWS